MGFICGVGMWNVLDGIDEENEEVCDVEEWRRERRKVVRRQG
jgi:hypothetical protein